MGMGDSKRLTSGENTVRGPSSNTSSKGSFFVCVEVGNKPEYRQQTLGAQGHGLWKPTILENL